MTKVIYAYCRKFRTNNNKSKIFLYSPISGKLLLIFSAFSLIHVNVCVCFICESTEVMVQWWWWWIVTQQCCPLLPVCFAGLQRLESFKNIFSRCSCRENLECKLVLVSRCFLYSLQGLGRAAAFCWCSRSCHYQARPGRSRWLQLHPRVHCWLHGCLEEV